VMTVDGADCRARTNRKTRSMKTPCVRLAGAIIRYAGLPRHGSTCDLRT
jgi:hypothetical protein